MNSRPFALTRTAKAAELRIYGDIGENWSAASITASAVAEQLADVLADVEAITVRINSYGGSVADGLAIYSALRRHPARVVAVVDGVAASIASLIAAAGDEVEIAASATMMLHAPWSGSASGNAVDLREQAEVLDHHARAMAEAYAAKTRRPVAEVLALLTDGKDHWFTAREAVAFGLADRITADSSRAALPLTAFAGLNRYLHRAPATIAAALRNAEQGVPAMSTPPNAAPAAADPQAAALAAVRERNAHIRAAVHEVMDVPGIRQIYEAALLDPSQPADAVLAKCLAVQAAAVSASGGAFRMDGHEAAGSIFSQPAGGSDFAQAASDGLLIRAGVRVAKPHPAARDMARLSLVDLARTCVSRGGRTLGADSPAAIVKAAMTTSDFPLVLSDSLGKALRNGMESEPATHRTWAVLSTAADFRAQHRVILGSAPDLVHVAEAAEYTNGPLAEDRQSLQPVKFGRLVSLTWESLLADNLGAFLGLGRAMGAAALRCEADALYDALLAAGGAGADLADSVALFDATRNNTVTAVTGTGKPLTAAALGAARAKLRRQTNVGGGLLNLSPKVLVVAPEREHEAEVLAAAATVHTSVAGAEGLTPAWISGLTVVAEPRLSATDVFYLFADPAQIGTAEVAIVDGSPSADEIEEKTRDVLTWKVRHAFAAGFVDFRGVVKATLSAT